MMKMGEFKSKVEAAAEQRAPHRIVRYVYELASMFHSDYRAERVIGADEKRCRRDLHCWQRSAPSFTMRCV